MALNKIVKENELKKTPYHSYKFVGTFHGERLYEEFYDQVKYDRDKKHYEERQVIIDNKTTIDKNLIYENIIDLTPEPVVTYSVRPNYETNRLIVEASDGNVTNIQWTHNLLKWQINDNVLVFREMNRETNEMYDRFYNLKTNTAVQSRKVLLENRDRNPDPDPESAEEGGSDYSTPVPGPYFAYLAGGYYDTGLRFNNIDMQYNSYADDSGTNFSRKTGQYPLGGFFAKKYFNQTYTQTWGEAIPNPADWSSVELYNEYKDIGYPLSLINESYSAHKHYWEFTFEPDDREESNALFFTFSNYFPSLTGYGSHTMYVNPKQRSVQFIATSALTLFDQTKFPTIPHSYDTWFLFNTETYFRLSAFYNESPDNKYTFRSVIEPQDSGEEVVSLYMNDVKLTNHYVQGGPNSSIYDHHNLVYGYTHTNSISANDPNFGSSRTLVNGVKPFDWLSGLDSNSITFNESFGMAKEYLYGGSLRSRPSQDFYGVVRDMKLGTDIKGDLYHFPLTQDTDEFTGIYKENIGTNSYDESLLNLKYGYDTSFVSIGDNKDVNGYDEAILSGRKMYRFGGDIGNGAFRNKNDKELNNEEKFEIPSKFENPLWSKRKPKRYSIDVKHPFDQSLVENALSNLTPDYFSTAMYILSTEKYSLSAGSPIIRTGHGGYSNASVRAANVDAKNNVQNKLSNKEMNFNTQSYPFWNDLKPGSYNIKRNPDCWYNKKAITCFSVMAEVHPFRTSFVLLSPRHVMSVTHIRDDFDDSFWNDGDTIIPFMNMNNEFVEPCTNAYVDLSSVAIDANGTLKTNNQGIDYSIFHLTEDVTLSGIEVVKFLPRDQLPKKERQSNGIYYNTNKHTKFDFNPVPYGVRPNKEGMFAIEHINFNGSYGSDGYTKNGQKTIIGTPDPQYLQPSFKWGSQNVDKNNERTGDSSRPVFIPHGEELIFVGMVQNTQVSSTYGHDNQWVDYNLEEDTYVDRKIPKQIGNSGSDTTLTNGFTAMSNETYWVQQQLHNVDVAFTTLTIDLVDDIQAAMNKLSDDKGTQRYELQYMKDIVIPEVDQVDKVTQF